MFSVGIDIDIDIDMHIARFWGENGGGPNLLNLVTSLFLNNSRQTSCYAFGGPSPWRVIKRGGWETCLNGPPPRS